MFLAELSRAIELLKHAIGWPRAHVEPATQAANYWTAKTVEAAIDEAGRDEVFAEARRLGWADGYAPLWVWGNIAREVSARKYQQPTVH